MTMRTDGIALMEVILASTLGLVVLLGLGSADIAKERIRLDTRVRSGVATPEQLLAGLAALRVAQDLERADRLNLIAADNVQVRRPPATTNPNDFDNGTLYRWDQYRRDAATNTLVFYGDTGNPAVGCTARRELASQITAFSVTLETGTTNRYSYSLTWNDGTRSRTSADEVTIRNSGSENTGITTGLQTPGGPDVSPPPAACTS